MTVWDDSWRFLHRLNGCNGRGFEHIALLDFFILNGQDRGRLKMKQACG